MTLQEAADVIYGNVKTAKGPSEALPPAIMAIIIQVIANIITSYGPVLLDKLTNHIPLNICDKLVVKTTIKKACPDRDTYRNHGRVIYDAILQSTGQFTPAQISSLIGNVT